MSNIYGVLDIFIFPGSAVLLGNINPGDSSHSVMVFFFFGVNASISIFFNQRLLFVIELLQALLY